MSMETLETIPADRVAAWVYRITPDDVDVDARPRLARLQMVMRSALVERFGSADLTEAAAGALHDQALLRARAAGVAHDLVVADLAGEPLPALSDAQRDGLAVMAWLQAVLAGKVAP